jgi:putative CocE/NonD family hydrolase
VLNLSGWYDDAYGVEGAATNYRGLVQARRGQASARAHLVLGPWTHGVPSPADGRAGDLDFGPDAGIDYDALVLDFHDHYLRGIANRFATAAPVRHFVMGANEWRDEGEWPPRNNRAVALYFDAAADGGRHRLQRTAPSTGPSQVSFTANPLDPVTDPYRTPGAHDYRALEARQDVLTFETEPLTEDLWVAGDVTGSIHASCDCRDFDLWVRLQDVHPDGRAFNLGSPGNDVLRASYREPAAGRQLLQPGRIHELRLPAMPTSIRFARGHRIRAQVSASFAPHLSRNLQTGESEIVAAEARPATINIHHGAGRASRMMLPVQD